MKNRTVKACQICGNAFMGGGDQYYCLDCSKEKKQNSSIRLRECVVCGSKFYGGPRAMYCPDCVIEVKKIYNKEWKKRKAVRPLGSTDKCQRCGTVYVVRGGLAKYCDDCKKEAYLERQRKRKRDYNKKSNQREKNKKNVTIKKKFVFIVYKNLNQIHQQMFARNIAEWNRDE